MFFLIQMKIKNDGNVEKGTSYFDTMKEALVQFHIAMSSAMQKDDVQKFTSVILNENGLVQRVEVYEAEIHTPVEEVVPSKEVLVEE